MKAAPEKGRGRERPPGWLAAVAVVCACLVGAATAGAHDFWLEPEAVPMGKGEELALHLRMGTPLKTEEERALQKDRITRFELFSDQAKKRDLLAAGQEGQTPVAKLRLEPGASLTVMDRTPRPILMEAEKFNRYLSDEGQEAILALRARLGQTEQGGKEVYTRYLKVLIQERDLAGSIPSTLYKRRVGQRLEILLENDPGRMKPDKTLTVKMLFEGKPLAGAKVFACRRDGGDSGVLALTAVTSAQGLAEFKLDQTGEWLVRLVHFRLPAERKPESNAPWESFWASYSFAVREAPVLTPKDG